MTTKLEELKALMDEEKKCRLEWLNSRAANDDLDDVNSFLSFYRSAKRSRVAFSEELLPSLIAVAEAAKKICCHDFSVSDLDGDLMLDMRHLETALEPLTKDADK